jgi:hypothetical protein
MMTRPMMPASTPASCLLFILAASLAAAPEEPSAPEALVVAPGMRLSLVPAALGDRTEAALDGGVFQPAGALRAPASGDHWLAVASRDAVGNVSATRWLRLRVDAEPPRIGYVVSPSPTPDEKGRQWVAEGARIEFTATDALAGVRGLTVVTGGRTVEGAGATVAVPLGDDGTATAVAVDRVGNRGETAVALNVDAQPPRGSIALVGTQVDTGASIVGDARATLRLDRDDEGSGVAGWTGRVDGRETGPEAWPGPWPAGPHAATAEIVDRVGHRARVGPFSFEIDAEAPRVTWTVTSEGIDSPQGERVYRGPVTVCVSAEDAPAGVAELRWSVDGQAWTAVGETLTTPAASIAIRARDRVGNEATTTAAWRLDAEPPLVLLDDEVVDAANPPSLERPAGHELRIAARDDGAGVDRVSLSIDGGPWGAAPDVLQFLDAGRHRLALEATDRLGNRRRVAVDVRLVKAVR